MRPSHIEMVATTATSETADASLRLLIEIISRAPFGSGRHEDLLYNSFHVLPACVRSSVRTLSAMLYASWVSMAMSPAGPGKTILSLITSLALSHAARAFVTQFGGPGTTFSEPSSL